MHAQGVPAAQHAQGRRVRAHLERDGPPAVDVRPEAKRTISRAQEEPRDAHLAWARTVTSQRTVPAGAAASEKVIAPLCRETDGAASSRSVAAPVNGVGAVWKERVPPAATAKLSSASGAAAYAASPGCVAATVQVPGPSSVNTVPCNVHVPGVSDVRLTGSPELAAALTR